MARTPGISTLPRTLPRSLATGHQLSIPVSFIWTPQSLVLTVPPGEISGIIALATDDLLHGGDEHHHAKLELLRQKYKLGKYTFGSGRFVGKDFLQQEDGSIIINQAFYVNSKVQLIPITRERKRRRFSPCTAMEVESLRALVGTLAWLSKETRCDLVGKTSLLQQAFPRPLVKDLIFANQIAKEAIDYKDLGIKLMPIPMTSLRAGVVTDASWENSRKMGMMLEGGGDDEWEETPRHWIRHHRHPRTVAFHPAAAPHGPDIHSLEPQRIINVQGADGQTTSLTDEWCGPGSIKAVQEALWTGSTVFNKLPDGEVLPAERIHIGHEQLGKLFSQGGEIVILYDENLPASQSLQMVSLAAWKSYRLKRRTVNTLSSETQALVRGLGSVHWYRVLILESRGLSLSARDWQKEVSQLPFICVTDSKSLYDVVKKCINPASQCEDKRSCIDVSLVKQEIQDLGGTIRWVDGRTMLADTLTKDVRAEYLRHVLRTGFWSILEEGASLQHKLLERSQKRDHVVMWLTFG